ncbi:MAG: HAMP domain-containing histidine kinase [Anaerolineae bacterium]|nr:HAMP domain-containing histidine kinase [Anaerolineae bacterium]
MSGLSEQIAPFIILLILTVIEAVVLAIYSWRKRKIEAAITFGLTCVLMGLWALLTIVYYAADGLEAKDVFARVNMVGITLLPAVWWAFTAQYVGKGRWLNRQTILLLLAIPSVTIILNLTNEFHHLMYVRRYLDTSGVVPELRSDYGLWFWVHTVYSYLLISYSNVLLILSARRTYAKHRAQATLLVLGVIVPWIANVMFVLQLVDLPVDLTPFAFSISLLVLAWTIFRYDLLDLVPIALQKVFNQLPDPVLVLDSEHRIAMSNPAARTLVGDAASSMVGKALAEVVPPNLAGLQTLLHDGDGASEIKAEILNGSAATRWFDVRITTLDAANAQAVGTVLILHDITERKQNELALAEARDEALQASQYKTQMLGKISHDLRTPLSVIAGYADLLLMGSYGKLNGEQTEPVGDIKTAAKDLDKLIRQLIDQTNLQDGKLSLKQKPFALQELVDRFTSAQVLAENKGLSCGIEVDANLPLEMQGDLDRLAQILQNLMSNAIKFTRKGGQIKVRLTRTTEDTWAMSVQDTGVGIAPEALNAIFEPFYQLAQDNLPDGRRGHGLGLAFAKDLTEVMGGEIQVKSTPGAGSMFTVLLPLLKAKEPVS